MEAGCFVPATGPAKYSSTIKGVQLEIIHPSSGDMEYGSPSQDDEGVEISWSSEERGCLVVSLADLRLRVNDLDYGSVKTGDSVRVDVTKGTKVIVNGEERTASAK